MNASRFFVPGKVVLCGEYAVVEPGGEAIVAAVSVGVEAVIWPAARARLVVPGLPEGVEIHWDGQAVVPSTPVDETERRALAFALAALTEVVALCLAQELELPPFQLELAPMGDPLGPTAQRSVKLGLGSSASATAAASLAALSWAGFRPLDNPAHRDLWHRLAERAHRKAQGGKGSGVDVAAAVYGGVVHCRQTDAGLEVRPVEWPELFRVVVAWTGSQVSTTESLASVTALWDQEPWFRDHFVHNSRAWTRAVLQSLVARDASALLRAMSMHRRLLLELGERARLVMESPALQGMVKAASRFGTGKQSGAGGGDCGVVFLRTPAFLQSLQAELRQLNLVPLQLVLPDSGPRQLPLSRGAARWQEL